MADDVTITDPATDPVDPPTDPVTDPGEPLGEKGEKALAAFKERARTAEREAKARADELAKIKAELDELRTGQLSEQEKAIEAARKEGADAATAKAEEHFRGIVDRASVLTAASKFLDPEDASRFLDVSELPRAEDGTLDKVALAAALDAVLETKPHLAKPASTGTADGGPRGASAVGQLTRDALKSMTPDEIDKAHREGRLNDLLAGNS